ncbi:MAG: HAMP domain-containing histidine kinase [Eubacterium sp.]|nr:HAMP domain-containing histidine kinase [Eubacterium sp.]
MTKRLRKKIIILLMVVYCVSFAFIAAAYNYSYYRNGYSTVREDLYSHYRILAETDEDNPVNVGGIHVVSKDDDGNLSLYRERLSDTEEAELIETAEYILTTKQKSGRIGHWQYENSVYGGQLLIAFCDVTEEIDGMKNLVATTVVVGLLTVFLWYLFVFRFSKFLVRPLETAMEKQKEFMLSAGHELKTPLTVIRSSLDVMRQDGMESKYLDFAIDETDRMSGLVTEILEVSRLEEGSGDNVKKEKIDLSAAVRGGTLPFEAPAFEKGVEITVDIEEGIEINGDKSRMERLTGIFVDNAIKHTEKGGQIRVILERTGGRIILTVANQGEEIPAEDREKIFEKFYRVDKSRNREEGRYGLGLSIAAAIAFDHGGKITVNCEDGWTYFMFSL